MKLLESLIIHTFLGNGKISGSFCPADPAFHQTKMAQTLDLSQFFHFSALRVVFLNRNPVHDSVSQWSPAATTKTGNTWQCTGGFDYHYNAGSATHLLWKTICIFFLSALDILNVSLSVINLLLEMRGLRIMMTLLWS